MVFNLNHQHLVSSLSCAKQKYFLYFFLGTQILADLLMLVYLIIEACIKLKRSTFSENIAR